MEVTDKSVVVHHCFLGIQISEELLLPDRRYIYIGDPEKIKQYRMLPNKCRCRKHISVPEAEAAWANGSAEDVYKKKDGRVIPVRDERGYPTMIWCRFWTDAKAKIARIDMITKADIERAYISLVEESQTLIEEVHKMQLQARAALVVPFRPDPFEGRVLFPFCPDERTSGGHQNKGLIYLTS